MNRYKWYKNEYNEGVFGTEKDSNTGIITGLICLQLVIALVSLFGWCLIKLKSTYKKNLELLYPDQKPAWIQDFFFVFCFYSLIKQQSIIGFVTATISSIIFLSYRSNPVWIAIELLILFVNLSPTSQYVIQSTTKNGKQLLVTLFLGILVISAYAQIVSLSYRDSLATRVVLYSFSDGFYSDAHRDFCKNLFECYLLMLNVGTRGSGVADILTQEGYEGQFGRYFGRFILDMYLLSFLIVYSSQVLFHHNQRHFAQCGLRYHFGHVRSNERRGSSQR